jgi:hypothetical protein
MVEMTWGETGYAQCQVPESTLNESRCFARVQRLIGRRFSLKRITVASRLLL